MATPTRIKGLLALLAGVLAAMAMPGIGAWPLAFVCLIPFFHALEGGKGGRIGFLFGVSYLSVDLRWVLTLTRFTPLVIPGFLLLVGVFSLSFAGLGFLLTWRKRYMGASLLLAAPIGFGMLEIARAQGELGTTFSALFHSLYRVPALIQAAAVFGPWSVTALLVAVNVAFYLAVRERRLRFALAGIGLVAAMAAFALLPVPASSPDTPAIEVAVVSSEVRQEVKLDARNLQALTERYAVLGQQAAGEGPDLIVFPESFLPTYVLRDDALLERFARIAREANVAMLFGTGEYRDREIYNSVVWLNRSGEVAGVYDMVRPVPFGEYIPWRELWEAIGLAPLIDSFLPGDLTPGKAVTPLGGIGTPICFESTFPSMARRFALGGAEAIVTVTNDAWFAGSSELHAHFAAAVFRAVETRRWVVQAANGGVSGVIDPRGSIVAATRGEGVTTGSVFRVTGTSLYTRFGDLPMLVLLGLGAGVILLRRIRRQETDGGE